MATYTYLACDLITGEVIAELPLSGVTFTNTFNAAGTLSASLFLAGPGLGGIDWYDAIQVARVAIYVDRDGTLVWGGPLWTTSYDSDTQSVTMGASETVSYLGAIRVAALFNHTEDQFQIVRDLLTVMTGLDSHHPTITVDPPSGTSGVSRTITVQPYELKRFLDVLDLCSQPSDGIDYSSTVAYSADGLHTPSGGIHMAYPSTGRTATASSLLFSFPGNLTKFTWPEDGTAGPATDITEVGAGSGAAQLVSHRTNPGLLTGYPHLWSVVSHTDVNTQPLLDGFATADAARLLTPMVLPTITLNNDTDPHLGDWVVGDWCRVQLLDPRFPLGTDQQLRILTTSVTPGDDGDEVIVLSLGQS